MTDQVIISLDLKPPAPFDADGDSTSFISQRWKEWRERFTMYTIASNITDDAQKRAVLLYVAGPSVYKIFKTLPESGTTYNAAIEKLDQYFQPQKNLIYERYVFKQCHPQQSESVDSFITRLRELAETCEFNNADNEIRDQFVMTCTSHNFRTKLLREKDLTLPKLLTMARAKELAEKQASKISDQERRVNEQQKINQVQGETPAQRQSRDFPKNECRNCGGVYTQGHNETCPAKGKSCRVCGKQNHFAKVCRSTMKPKKNRFDKRKSPKKEKVKATREERQRSSSEDEYTFSLTSSRKNVLSNERNGASGKTNSTFTQVQIAKTAIGITIDSGASTNILDRNAFQAIKNKNKNIELSTTQTKIYSYNAVQPLPLMGKCCLPVELKGKTTVATFYVVKGTSGSLLGNETAEKLGILKIQVNKTDSEESVDLPASTRKILEKYPQLFNGIGCLEDYEQHLHVNPTVTPVAQRPRRVPFHLRKQVAEKLTELQDLDIIEPAGGPTTWVSPIVAAPKPHNSKEVRVCGDYRRPNEALLRERHPIPTVDEMMEDMAGAVMFSKLDLKAGYHQIVLEEKSRDLTTFCTHKGLFRYKRLPFGLSCASEVFQNAIQLALHGLTGVRNIADDIIVWGKSQDEHNRNLEAVLQRLASKKLTLNRAKCKYNQPSLWFYGYILSKDGVSADPKKVEAIKHFKQPTDVSELRSFLGLANYCSRFIKDFSTITAPLRDLTTKSSMWNWSQAHQRCFENIKEAIASDCVMAFYDPNRPTQLTVDASPVGLGAVLAQTQEDGQVRCIAYASRSLSSVECRYSQTEKEALAAVWGCERFHIYLLGTQFDLITDHKPLEVIYGPKSKPCLRIERWLLRLQQYRFNIKYRPGASNPADVLSRQPLFTTYSSPPTAEEYINFVQDHAVPKSLTLEEIATATEEDPELQKVIQSVQSNAWDKKDHSLYATIAISLVNYLSRAKESSYEIQELSSPNLFSRVSYPLLMKVIRAL